MEKNASSVPRLLILGVQGLDWNLISEKLLNGTLLYLTPYVSQGASGPLYSLNNDNGWISIATGRRSYRHGILASEKERLSMQPEEFLQEREGPAFWNILSQIGLTCGIIAWPETKAEKISGGMVSASFFESNTSSLKAWSIPRDSVTPAEKAALFTQFRLHPSQVPKNWCEAFIPAYFKEEPEVEIPLATIRSVLAADRGKLNLGMHWIQKEEWDVLGICFSGLETIASIGWPYRAPFTPNPSLDQSEIFGGIVDQVYEWYDNWFKELFTVLPPHTNVLIVSNHGMHHHRYRTKLDGDRALSLYLTQEEQGCLIASGPSFAKQIPIRRATLLDVCPTILSLYGIQQAQDIDGIALQNILLAPSLPQKIVTWNKASVTPTKRRNVETLELPTLCRLGMSFLSAGRLLLAITALRTAWERAPYSLEIASALASALLLAGHRIPAAFVLQTALQQHPTQQEPSLFNMNLRLGWRKGDDTTPSLPPREVFSAVAQWLASPDEFSVNRLFRLFRSLPESFLLSLLCGFAASWRRNWKEARLFLNRASALNASDPESLVEISRIQLRRKMPKAALKTIRLALERAPLHLRGIVTLAETLFALGNTEAAAKEAKRAARFIEQRRPALLILARISRAQGDFKKAARYRRLACHIKKKFLAIGKSIRLPQISLPLVPSPSH